MKSRFFAWGAGLGALLVLSVMVGASTLGASAAEKLREAWLPDGRPAGDPAAKVAGTPYARYVSNKGGTRTVNYIWLTGYGEGTITVTADEEIDASTIQIRSGNAFSGTADDRFGFALAGGTVLVCGMEGAGNECFNFPDRIAIRQGNTVTILVDPGTVVSGYVNVTFVGRAPVQSNTLAVK